MPSFEVRSEIVGSVEDISCELLNMGGVNYELFPFLRMTAPFDWSNKSLTTWPTDTHIFNSVILLFGLLPVDFHRFKFSKVWDSGFKEASSSLVNREWKHERTIVQQGEYCAIQDVVEYVPKISFLGKIMKPVYKAIFGYRHKRLKTKYAAEPLI